MSNMIYLRNITLWLITYSINLQVNRASFCCLLLITLPLKLLARTSLFYLKILPAAAAAKLLQSCLTLCDGSPPALLSLGFSRQEHWSGLPFPSPMHESESESEVAQSCPTLSDPMDCSPPGSSIMGFSIYVYHFCAVVLFYFFPKTHLCCLCK